ncbi:MAG: MarR family transcriptional regulator [Acutalibacteraceae bacterium]|nr:MarR family transcriptional regulator [Acutalibacteraceae bacterium]
MNSDILAAEMLKTFEDINIENILNRLKLSLKGENAIIMLLNDYGGMATPGKLSERTDFTAARLSAIIKSLESKGIVERRQNTEDKRSSYVALTADGYEIYMRLRAEIISNALTIIEQLGEEDVNEFLRIAKRLVNIVNTHIE